MILRKLATWFWNLFFEPIIYQEKKITKDPCWKHEAFKKGCPTCRSMNA